MKVEILKPFRSKRYQKVMKKGETVDSTEAWAREVEKEGLGAIVKPVVTTKDIPLPVRRRVKQIREKMIETAAIEPQTEEG